MKPVWAGSYLWSWAPQPPDRRLWSVASSPLLVIVVPLAPQPLGFVPDLDEVLVVLNDDGVLVELSVEIGPRSAPVVLDLELVLALSALRLHVNAFVLINGALKMYSQLKSINCTCKCRLRMLLGGQRLGLIWQSGCFHHKAPRVRRQPTTIFVQTFVFC